MNAKTMFEDILGQATIRNLFRVPLHETGLTDETYQLLDHTHFNDPYDTLIYSKLIEEAIRRNPQVESIIDCGTGSSIPGLLAIKRSGRNIHLTGIDIDENAEDIGKGNAEKLGLTDQFTFVKGNFVEYLKKIKLNSKVMIVSNPPYIATPPELRSHHFTPVDGGIDGAKYLKIILEMDLPAGIPVALLWGSLTSPEDVLSLMAKHYSLDYVEAYKIHFGEYTDHEVMKRHLYDLKDQGKIHFEKDERGEIQFVIGTILTRKSNL
jgi:methylase of polypeptide subunit release factors